MERILEIKDLRIAFSTSRGEIPAVRGINLDINKGEALALVGESGCGKSVTAQAVMRLLYSPPGKIGGSVIFDNKHELLSLPSRQMQELRGREISMIFQDPLSSLNPTMKIGRQIEEVLLKDKSISIRAARTKCVELLKIVGIPLPERRAEQYAHELSGGMRQRVMIAMAVAGNPRLIIADEPTTALDATVQAQIMKLLKNLTIQMGTSILLITHDFGVVAGFCERAAVMYAGQIVELGTVEDIFYSPFHPYTKGLLQCLPRLDNEELLKDIYGQPPDPETKLTGCHFWPRCTQAMKICSMTEPPEKSVKERHSVRCWLTETI